MLPENWAYQRKKPLIFRSGGLHFTMLVFRNSVFSWYIRLKEKPINSLNLGSNHHTVEVTTNTPAHSETNHLFGFSEEHDVLGSRIDGDKARVVRFETIPLIKIHASILPCFGLPLLWRKKARSEKDRTRGRT